MRLTRHTQPLAGAFLPFALLGSTCGPTTPQGTGTVQFVLETSDRTTPLFIRVALDNAQPGWISVTHASGAPVYLVARCDIGDCRSPAAVCGAAVPVVRDISSAGSVEFVWDGNGSVLDATTGCERRSKAAEGAYVARFCHARAATQTGAGNSTAGMQGALVNRVCADVRFTLPGATTVRHRVP